MAALLIPRRPGRGTRRIRRRLGPGFADALDQGFSVLRVNHVVQVGIQRLPAIGHGDFAVLRLRLREQQVLQQRFAVRRGDLVGEDQFVAVDVPEEVFRLDVLHHIDVLRGDPDQRISAGFRFVRGHLGPEVCCHGVGLQDPDGLQAASGKHFLGQQPASFREGVPVCHRHKTAGRRLISAAEVKVQRPAACRHLAVLFRV